MPNWKKLITSGSSGSLAHLSVDTSVEATSFTGSLLSTNGIISSSGNLVSGELVYGTGGSSVSSSNLVYLDTANERVGIKTTSPQYPFHYVQDTGNALAVYEKTGGAAIFYEAQDTRGALGTVASHPLLFAINSAEVSRINTSGVYEGDVSGSIYATNGVISSSAQIASDISGSITSTSSSIASDIATLVSFSSSLETTIYDYTGSFTGDGSGLTGVQSTVTEQVTVTDSFTSATTHSIAHTFATKNLNVTVYDENDDIFIPARINTPTTESVVIYMEPATTGRAVISKGGHIVSGSIAVDIVSSSTVSDTFTSATTHSVAHTFGTKDVFVTVYDSNDDVFIPARISTPTTSSVVIYMEPATTGRVVIAKGGHLVSGSVAADPNWLAVSSSILPHTTEVFDLGSPSKRWKDLYLSGSTIDLGGTKITRDAATGDIEFLDSSDNRKSIKVDELQIGTGASARKIKVNNGRIQFTDTSDSVEDTDTGNIIPAANNTYDLGSPSAQFRHLYLSTASLYMDGTKVLSSTADVLTFTTDVGQSIKLLETGGDDIILQTGEGNIELKGTVEILTGRKIIDSGGTQVVFGDGIYVEGNIGTTGTVDGIDLQAFSASVSTSLANSTADYTELTNIPAGIISGAAQLPSGIVSSSTQTIANLAGSGIVSGALSYYTDSDTLSYINSLEVVSGSITHYTDSDTLSYINSLGVVSGSITHYTDSDVLTYINSLGVASGSVASDWDSVSSKPAGIVSSSAQITALTSYTETFTSQTAVTASHSLGTKNVTVSVYGSDDYMLFPTSIKTHDDNNVYVQFNSSRSGRIVITK